MTKTRPFQTLVSIFPNSHTFPCLSYPIWKLAFNEKPSLNLTLSDVTKLNLIDAN